ncbi:hypothetical protein [Aliivibrio fischeri]|uniref:Uncharacterized protein n=1 Tax=Aliivibrio fischeri TaxID=668 RepID=A0A510UP70_ALIFS|nr:hypothetical protein [Aliivibrio fischeri]GEK16266.1 hypothetical protein AFI02nite_43020 [Aliivibrio fischeri]
MLEILQENAAILISGLAVILSAAANWRTVKLNRETKVLAEYFRRRDMVLEVEKHFVLERELAVITEQKLEFIRLHSLLESLPHEVKRLKTNLKLLQQNITNQDQVRSTAELSNNKDIKLYISALTDYQRLQIRLKSDLEKEKVSYQDLKEQYADQ